MLLIIHVSLLPSHHERLIRVSIDETLPQNSRSSLDITIITDLWQNIDAICSHFLSANRLIAE